MDPLKPQNDPAVGNGEGLGTGGGAGEAPAAASGPEESSSSTPNSGPVDAAQVQALQDRYLRLYADFENFRKRAAREKKEAIQTTRAEVIRDVLPVLDHLENAVRSAREHGAPQTFVDGVRLIEEEFRAALARLGVHEVSAAGPLDVRRHEAVGCESSEEIPEGHILTLVRRGYQMGDRMLRPAQVVVSSGPSATGETEMAASESGDSPSSGEAGEEESCP